MIPTDTYHKGYRLSQVKEGEVTHTHIYYGTSHVASVQGGFHSARALVDSWSH